MGGPGHDIPLGLGIQSPAAAVPGAASSEPGCTRFGQPRSFLVDLLKPPPSPSTQLLHRASGKPHLPLTARLSGYNLLHLDRSQIGRGLRDTPARLAGDSPHPRRIIPGTWRPLASAGNQERGRNLSPLGVARQPSGSSKEPTQIAHAPHARTHARPHSLLPAVPEGPLGDTARNTQPGTHHPARGENTHRCCPIGPHEHSERGLNSGRPLRPQKRK